MNAKIPDKVFLKEDGRDWSYSSLLALSEKLWEYASNCGVKKYSKILIKSESPVYQAGAFLALEKIGAVPILLHNDLSNTTIREILQKNKLQGIWCVKGNSNEIWSDTSSKPISTSAAMGVLTSGTTGIPKVLYRDFRSWYNFFPIQNDVFGIDNNTVMFIHGSLSFTGNLNMFLAVMAAGGELLTCRAMGGRKWHGLLADNRATHIYVVPAKLHLLCRNCETENTILKYIIGGSQLITQDLYRSLVRVFPGADTILYYGSSELSYISYKIMSGKEDENNLGRPFENIAVTSRDGELFVDTPYGISGIHMPYSCGDTGYVNDRGEIIFTGRKTDWINKGGYKISCNRLERLIRQVDGVRAVAVMPFNDKIKGQEIAAFVAAKEEISVKDLRDSFALVLNERERPKKIILLGELPLNDRGKVDKQILGELL
ncbi:AMP-binding protein [Anaerovibrio sp.]|uniref:AMP-binding protein n=1 Tax=Anaerovibrio sp. TaxID=1872532 RepID=UPI0025D44034|nr:AMP-binding protein [Anaerovibrio sp.]